MNRFLEFAKAQAEWSQATFGLDSERGPVGPLKHLAIRQREGRRANFEIMRAENEGRLYE